MSEQFVNQLERILNIMALISVKGNDAVLMGQGLTMLQSAVDYATKVAEAEKNNQDTSSNEE